MVTSRCPFLSYDKYAPIIDVYNIGEEVGVGHMGTLYHRQLSCKSKF